MRVYARPTLDRFEALAAVGVRHGFGDEWLKIGGLKGFVDGIMGNSTARFYEPYLTSGERGAWRDIMRPEGNMLRLLLGADAAGHWPQVHAIGDEAIDTLLDLFEQVMERSGPRPPGERRFRVIHAQVLRGPEVARRMARLGVLLRGPAELKDLRVLLTVAGGRVVHEAPAAEVGARKAAF